VALAAVVGLVPAFAQVGRVLPAGEEVLDDELERVVGEYYEPYPGFWLDVALSVFVGVSTGYITHQSGASLTTSVSAGFLAFGVTMIGRPSQNWKGPGLTLAIGLTHLAIGLTHVADSPAYHSGGGLGGGGGWAW